MLANTHHEKNVPVASSAELSQANSELGGIAEPLHRPLDANTKSEIVSELSRIQSESFFNVPQSHEKLEKPNPSKVYFTGARGEPREEAESSLGLPAHGKTDGQLSSANLTSSKQATLTAIVQHDAQAGEAPLHLLTDIKKKMQDINPSSESNQKSQEDHGEGEN